MQRSSSSPIIALRARQHRCALTPTEQALWAQLRGCRLGVWFRRQVPLGRFIVDFLAPSARLIVEVDGGYHAQRRSLDARRDQHLQRLGHRILRLEADLVRTNIATAVSLVRAALESQTR
jgi:very-short-patch-repair endonuclease